MAIFGIIMIVLFTVSLCMIVAGWINEWRVLALAGAMLFIAFGLALVIH